MNDSIKLTAEELQQAIVDYLRTYSIEATPHDAAKLDEIAAELPPGTRVYVAHPPGTPIDDVVDLSIELKRRGLTGVPHIIARKLSSRDQLARALETLSKSGVDEALCIAGDIAVEDNAFDSSLEVLQTGLFGEFGFSEVGVAGHPEGSKAIGEERVEQALTGKNEFAKTAPFRLRLVTQFGFDPDGFIAWEKSTGAAGIDLPIHFGMAGPTSVKQLIRFAALCGVGASARMLKTRTGAMANLLSAQAPDDQIVRFATQKAIDPGSRIVGAHFFAFGGVAKSARWVNAVRAGKFELNRKLTGFSVQ